MTEPSVALIINTYEQPDYLGRVLRAVSGQFSLPDEVVLADDGSGEETKAIFSEWSSTQPFRCHHAWQAHGGFRRAKILNESISHSTSNLIVFLDGDTIPSPAFLWDHRAMARQGCFVQGHRCLVQKNAAVRFGQGDFARDRLQAMRSLQLSGLFNAFRWPVPLQRRRRDLRGIRGCNLGIWREDLVRVNGYNEAFEGWGREDSELAARLMNSSVQRLDVRGRCVCFHLWHPPADRSGLPANDHLLKATIQSQAKWCEQGLNLHREAR